MAHDFVAALADAGGDLRIVLEDRRVRQVAGGQLQPIEQIENAPDPDTQSVVSPGIVAMIGRGRECRQRVAEPLAEGEMLDVERNIDGQPLAVRPIEIGSIDDRRIVVALVARKIRGAAPAPCLVTAWPARAAPASLR
ncbi:MAG TPA: hypothetical protein VKU84_04450 [Stellaceae bacterium]|nr:hypothetical protein [Stellaceae bacterium]